MLKVGLTGRILNIAQYDEYRECLDVRWPAFIKDKLDAIPVLMPSAIDPASFITELGIGAVILTGGNNIGSISGCPEDVYRDHYEGKIIHAALNLGLPIIGVCRGMQMIATYFGQSVQCVSDHVSVNHNIKSSKTTKFSSLIDSLSPVNSYHDYKISGLPDGFEVLAYSEDGVIEAFMFEAKKVFGLMWHPERVALPIVQKRHAKLIKEMINA